LKPSPTPKGVSGADKLDANGHVAASSVLLVDCTAPSRQPRSALSSVRHVWDDPVELPTRCTHPDALPGLLPAEHRRYPLVPPHACEDTRSNFRGSLRDAAPRSSREC